MRCTMPRRWLRPRGLFQVLVLLGMLGHRVGNASNWAQVSGKRKQNVAIVSPTPWTKRHGHAVAALDYTPEYMSQSGKSARIFVIGGDSSVQGTQDLRAYPGGGSFRNDVWSTTGIKWDVRLNILKQNKFGDPLPQIIAEFPWQQRNSGKTPPKGVTYHDWIACAAAPWAIHPVEGCDDPKEPPGAYLADNMFSPRRNFVAIAYQDALFVIGGRAREHYPVPQDELLGGIGVKALGPINVRWREYAVLKNDVWVTKDAGASWQLVTPGCAMPQESLVHKVAGDRKFQCENDDNCEGDARCKFDPVTNTGICVCNMWSAREFHAVAIHQDQLYLSGGYTFIQLGNCGVEEWERKRQAGEEYACGGGYRAYMNDVWRSKDGQTWTLVQLHSPWQPRGEHAMVSFKTMLYIFGGRTGDAMDMARQLLNDMWVSTNGSIWAVQQNDSLWSPRAQHAVVVLPGATDKASTEDPDDELLLMYGEDEERVLSDIWSWKGSDSLWIQDFAPSTPAGGYVDLTSDISLLKGMIDEDAMVLRAAGLGTIQELAGISFDQTIDLRQSLPTLCDYIHLAREINTTCTVTADQYEGEEFANIKVIQGKYGDAQAAAAAAAAAAVAVPWDGCFHVGSEVTDSKTGQKFWPPVNHIAQVQVLRDVFDDAQTSMCKWKPLPRSGLAGIVFQRRVFMLAGMVSPDYFENDVWYRDKRFPRAQLTKVPISGSHDTVFRFESDEPGCIFEYHVTNMVEMLVVRNWTKSIGEVNFLKWLDGGRFRFRVRAVDPAGNVDALFESGRNEYIWIYKPKLPWAVIIGCTSAFVVLVSGVFMEWRKRRKRAAMERYAMKRMRRKLKGSKAKGKGAKGENDAHWRDTYDEAKDTKGKKKKGKLAGVKPKKAAAAGGTKKTKGDGATSGAESGGDKKPKKKKSAASAATTTASATAPASASKKAEGSPKKKKATAGAKKAKKE